MVRIIAASAAPRAVAPLTARPRLGGLYQPHARPVATRRALSNSKGNEELVVDFRPFEEVKPALATVEKAAPSESFARVDYQPSLESAINEQINIEYNISYVYHALHSYFDRDNVALPNIAKYFNEQSLEERSHAQSLIRYQNKRGGRVKLHALVGTQSEFDHADKGDALYAFELALSLEKLNFTKLWKLHDVAVETNDPEACNYIEDMLDEQARDVKIAAEYVSQLRRVAKGLGVYVFDKTFLEDAAAAAGLGAAGVANALGAGMGAGIGAGMGAPALA